MDPKEAAAGATVTVAGKGFETDSAVAIRRKDADEDVKWRPVKTTYEDGKLTVTLPDDLAPGSYLLRVTTNGVSSESVTIKITEG